MSFQNYFDIPWHIDFALSLIDSNGERSLFQ